VKQLFLYFIAFHLVLFCSAQEKWKHIDHSNGFHLQIPSYFKTGLLVAAGTLQYFDDTADSSITVTVETFGKGTTGALQQQYKSELQRGQVTYSVLKPNWFVVSGTDNEGVFYFKTIVSKGLMHHLRISYPLQKRIEANLFLAKMAASFH
jgi:hypothetical protein